MNVKRFHHSPFDRRIVAGPFWIIAILLLAAIPVVASVTVTQLRCESRFEPLGIDALQPRLSWIIESKERAQTQTAYRVLVASTEKILAEGRGDLWDSGKVAGRETIAISYAGQRLRSGQRCFWKVQVWDQDGKPSRWSQPTWWEMGLLDSTDWTGQWLNDGKANPTNDADFYQDDPAPLFRHELNLAKPIRRARLYISGLGYYEASLNGQRVGDRMLDPGWTMYGQRVFYSAYDVGGQLHKGANCLGVTLGNGWWNPLPLRLWGQRDLRKCLAVGRPRFIAQLNVEFTDGTTQLFASDETWKVADGPLLRNSIYLGEVYDARREMTDWNRPGFDDSQWHSPKVATEPIGPLQAQPQPPIKVRETFSAVRVTEPKPGVFIYDLGRNFAGWAEFRFRAPAGTKIVMRYGELLNADGTLNSMTSVAGQIKGRRKNKDGESVNIGGPGAPEIAWQSDTYIARGGSEETYVPRFTFHGFRFVEVAGLDHAPPLRALTGMQLSADVPDAGEFTCSNPMFNQIQTMCRRTFLANLFSVQSDCPHRERFGYGGDIVATSEALMLNFNMETFYAKVAADFADSARTNGMLTDTAPSVGIQYCGVGWAMAHPLLLAQEYRYYGNRRLVENQYAAARRWFLLVANQYPDGIVTEGLSDHESLTPSPAPLLVTPLYYQSARLVAELARILELPEDASAFEAIAEKSRQLYQQTFLETETGKIGSGTQASQAFALYSDLVPASERDKAVEVLVKNIQGERKGHLSTGILGTKFMLDVLSRAGCTEVAYDIVAQTNFPSWGWMLANGATTLWEHWAFSDNTYSHNHPMFGSVSQWFVCWLGGIQPQPAAVGFDRIIIRPQVVEGLNWVRCSYDSVRGKITSNWKRDGDRLWLEMEIPANTTAMVYVPASEPEEIKEGGKPVAQSGGIKLLRQDCDHTIFQVGSGHYSFEVTPQSTADRNSKFKP